MQAMQTAAPVGVREFAKLLSLHVGRKVAPSTVTRSIQRGVIPATPGTRGPLIDPDAGLRAYLANTDPERQAGALIRDGRGGELPLQPVADRSAPTPVPPPLQDDTSVAAMKTEKARINLAREQIEFGKEQLRLAEVEPLKRAFAKQVTGLVGQIEADLPSLAKHLAGELKVDQHAAAAIAREWFRSLRAKMAATQRAQGEALPELAEASADWAVT